MSNDKEIVLNILRTINNSNIHIDELNKIFNSRELDIIRNLYMDESITNRFDKEKRIEILSLTRKGKFLLFSYDNKESIEVFGNQLKERGYNTLYLGDYLKVCDLDRGLEEIFSLSDYDLFVHNLEMLENSRVTRRIMLRNNRNIG